MTVGVLLPSAHTRRLLRPCSDGRTLITPPPFCSAGKPGSRKRKVAPLLPAVNDMSQVPASMLLGTDFTAPRVKRAA